MSDLKADQTATSAKDSAQSVAQATQTENAPTKALGEAFNMAVKFEDLPRTGYPTHFEKYQKTMMVQMINGYMPDATIVCQDCVFRVHKAILSAQSKWFDKAFNGSFKEAHEFVIYLPEDNSNSVRRMIEFLYLGTFRVRRRGSMTPGQGTFIIPNFSKRQWCKYQNEYILVKMFAIADKFMIPSLEDFVMEHLVTYKALFPRQPFAELFHRLLEVASEETPSQRIRVYMAEFIADNRDCLLESHAGSDKILQVLQNDTQLLLAVTIALAKVPEDKIPEDTETPRGGW